MTRFKSLGLALVAVFAMSAVVATTASAHFTSPTDNTTVTLHGGTQQFIAVSGAEVHCETVTGHGVIGTDQVDLTISPTFDNCKLVEKGVPLEAKVDSNGCTFTFTTTVPGTVHIECPAGKVIKVTAKIAGAFQECMDIHAQTPTVQTVDYTNGTQDGVMDFGVKSTVEGITYERTGLCKKAEAQLNEINDAKYIGEATATCEVNGVPVDCTKS
jgi:hypothetical protein